MANKFFAKKVKTDVGVFDSIGEYKYWLLLNKLRLAANPKERVADIQRQVTFKLQINDVLIGKYIADFVVTYADGSKEVIDFKNPYLLRGKGKSSSTAQLFQYKKKLMKIIFGIDIKIV